MSKIDDMAERVFDSYEDVKTYLGSDEGRELRRKVAVGLMFTAPILAKLPVMRASKVGKLVGLAGGAALIVKAAEMIRDWDPVPERAEV